MGLDGVADVRLDNDRGRAPRKGRLTGGALDGLAYFTRFNGSRLRSANKSREREYNPENYMVA
jgi:hypothetical protein